MQTTGVESDDVICSVGVLYEEKLLCELVNEAKKIPALASSIHNITNEMIQEKTAFRKSSVYKLLQEYNTYEHTLVSHNLAFHLQKLSQHGLEWQGGVVDTARVTKHLIPECELFSLNFLRYELQLYKQEEVCKQRYGIKCALVAHDVQSDVIITKLLFEYLSTLATLEAMQEMSFSKVLLEKLPVGKYQGRYIEEIVDIDRSYLQWMLQLPELDEDLRYSLEYYL